ncbi:fungal specific transcription factor domain-containing protein [Aspergillus mulundensis]|uniref:Transcription factor domain-containing protein n=1 Tax=Aspergillus mulundensis TaxID=1810919 RepID=A0A3D8RKS0_9EURO|nr:hypothetical protein DSM5745_07307 [Aspergillus mulundensis]RDW74645.1 hypothetical protein DSM5745_07307 [Aspergillus mulundensis]
MPPVSKTCQSCADSKMPAFKERMSLSPDWSPIQRLPKGSRIAALESKINEPTVDQVGLGNTEHFVPLSDGESAIKDIISRGVLDVETAERYLSNFKTKMLPHFCFVTVPPAVSAKQLRQKKPFLFLAILVASSYENMPLQRALGHEFKSLVASRMVVGGEVSFELLQGLLVFLAWSHYHSKPQRYTQSLHLAVSLVVDLRLDRPPQTKMWKTGLRFGPQHDSQDKTLTRPSWGRDEQRAVLGCYYLSASVAMLVQKISTIPRLPYYEECCKALLEANEHLHDKYMTYVIQLQFIAGKIDNLSSKHTLDLEKPGSGSELYITSLNSDLEVFRRRLPFDIYESRMYRALLAIQYHATGLCLYQLALNISGQHSQPHSTFDPVSLSLRDEMSMSAIVSATSILNLYIDSPSNEEVGFNNTQWVQMGVALLVAYRHTVAADKPDQTASFLSTLSKLESRTGALSTASVDTNGARDIFFNFEKRVVQIRRWVEELNKRQEEMSHARTDAFQQQQTLYSDLIDFDINGLMRATGQLDGSLWDSLPVETSASQVFAGFSYAPSIEQMMGDWV